MIDEIKNIVQNYLNSVKLVRLETGTVVSNGIKVSDKLTIPMVLVSGKQKKLIKIGDKVRLLRNLGGQDFFILEIMEE